MAAVLPTTIKQESLGSLKLIIADFANTVDNGDTWASGVKTIISAMISQTDASGTQASTGAAVSYTASTGAVTLQLAEDNSACTVHLYVKG